MAPLGLLVTTEESMGENREDSRTTFWNKKQKITIKDGVTPVNIWSLFIYFLPLRPLSLHPPPCSLVQLSTPRPGSYEQLQSESECANVLGVYMRAWVVCAVYREIFWWGVHISLWEVWEGDVSWECVFMSTPQCLSVCGYAWLWMGGGLS